MTNCLAHNPPACAVLRIRVQIAHRVEHRQWQLDYAKVAGAVLKAEATGAAARPLAADAQAQVQHALSGWCALRHLHGTDPWWHGMRGTRQGHIRWRTRQAHVWRCLCADMACIALQSPSNGSTSVVAASAVRCGTL